MKKTLLSLLILIITLTCSNWAVMAEENVNVVLDGKTITFDVPAQIINGRTMVPMRKIFEELGMAVEWFDETQTVMASKQGVVVEFPIGSTTVSRNTVEQTIDVPAQLVGSRTLVPVRFVSEFTGAEVVWDGNTNTVFINSTNNIKQLDWNDTYEYWGEVDNGKASGYGALYKKNDGSLAQIGKYIDSEIVVGSDFFDGGDTFTGHYENGKRAYGTYCYSNGDYFTGEYNDGQMSNGTYKNSEAGVYYTGTFENGEFVYGKKTFSNSESWAEGNFKNFSLHGYGKLYDESYNCLYVGNWTNGSMDGEFTIYDYANNITYKNTIKNGKVVNEKQERLEEVYRKVDELAAEYEELDAWYESELEELYDYITNGNPFETDWAKSIYQSYGVGSGNSSVSGLDSYAAANAARQQAALKAKADEAILSYNQTYINQQKQLIEDTYAQKRKNLDRQKETLLLELDELEKN